MLTGKKILIGITGGISAYKIPSLVRLFKKNGADVKVVMTPSATNFVTELTLKTVSNNEVYIDNFKIEDYKPEHISLCDWADIFVIAPASANTISKISNGICDNLLTSIVCAYKKQIVFVPAMNTGMWENQFVQNNIKTLKSAGYKFIEPESGFLACGTEGKGRMAEPETILKTVTDILNNKKILCGKKILITAGGTKEKIDPVRYITNSSSGKMGISLADSAYEMGADVILVSTFKIDKPYQTILTETALEMEKEVKSRLKDQDCIIMTAAVADYRIKNYSEQKLKKTDSSELTLTFTQNPDILKEISNLNSNAKIVGFCAESEDLINNAKIKIKNKGCDYLVANDISRKDIGFSADYNEVYILDKNENISHIERDTKTNIAKKILEKIFE
ncbi:MAG: bifunctional phosphopantothenoylcysteine decarboxylase/phosphopantothenate--cysteine ligase CoaBC [bacterium]|nr:bifunctional phosphopantothenoylcysteine decarboxylase/phosphopantothenate--cysteine ligase CoaBC [bacterium]